MAICHLPSLLLLELYLSWGREISLTGHKQLKITKKISSCFAIIFHADFSLISVNILKSLKIILNREKNDVWKIHASYDVMILYNRIKHLTANR